VATPTTVPTPSPTPIDVGAAFVEQMSARDFSAAATISGTLTVGPLEGTIDGEAAFSGGDSSMTMSITAGTTFKQETETISIGDASWSRQAPGPWLENPPASASKPSLGEFLGALSSVTVVGIETRNGKQVHHLRMSSGSDVPCASIGFDSETAKDATCTMDFYATDTGTPAVLAVTGEWTQVSGGVEVPTKMTFDIAFSDVGKSQTITEPTDVWVRYTSANLPYSMAHPADWTVKSTKTEDTYLLNGQGYVYVGVTPFTGSTAKFVDALKASYKKPFGGDPVSQTATTLGGVPAVRLIYQFTNDAAQDVTVADDVVSRDGTGWEVYLATGGGPEDVGVFDQFVATFQFAE